MDDPGWTWPYWKFGLKKDDLFTKLHDQYNTFPSSIQDPEAFHHDVFEISTEASTADQFHRLLANRKQQRLCELNNSLESASLEIIANPTLVGTEQWQYALQLFRTKSLDSLVRYFASYLPHDHPWHSPDGSTSSGSEFDSVDSITDSHSHGSFFDADDERAAVVHEPFPISTCIEGHLPPSPRSMTMCSDGSVDVVHHTYTLDNMTPARSLSFSESESEHFALQDSRSHLHDDDASQSSDPGSPITTISEMSDMAHFEMLEKEDGVDANEDEPTEAPQPPEEEIQESDDMETPTPKPEARATSFLDAKPSLPHRRHRSFSPSCPHPLSRVHTHLPHHDNRKAQRTPRLRRRDCSPGQERSRRPGEAATRVRKPLPDPIRSRPRGRRRADC
ncbi:hypothetical protein QBC33DRAFT_251020 [Phialemonium atrogriseum]|uniref:Uncharacterized protein n=1 Tax=Phialemonium atrogriseum TaxID=1093897 RepID=A0AAJ0FH96_9PEZI|nr:uncharacterized protein QBC33DRAFT_251020 [Phialemonium atrogriseum]KAK1763168.1 hypothetical protein QBC33DRAFT_251020 [Phialemonium atrogriseum]